VCLHETARASKEHKNVTGKVTSLFGDGSGLIEHDIYFEQKGMWTIILVAAQQLW